MNPEPGAWTPARIFMAVSSVIHVPLAVAGLFVNQAFPIGSSAAAAAGSDFIFGVFETNGWHTVGAVIVAAVSVFYAVRGKGARQGALILGITHIGLFLSLVVFEPETFWIASNAADQAVHAFTAIAGTAAGLMTTPRRSVATA